MNTVGAEASTGGSSSILVDFDDPFSDAVMVTVWLVPIVPAVTTKLPLVAPLASASKAGTDKRALAEEDKLTDAPPVGTAADNGNVHVAVPPFDNDAALQLRLVIVTTGAGVLTVTVPEEPVKPIDVPVAVAPIGVVIETVAVAEGVSVTLATTPFGMAVTFIPVRMQVVEPAVMLAH
jgi:hypothetical protein